MPQKLNEAALNHVLNDMTNTVENSKEEIFAISEEAREEHASLLIELQDIREKMDQHHADNNRMEEEPRIGKQSLAEESNYLTRYSGEEIREIHEDTHAKQPKCAVSLWNEGVLCERRDELERRIISLSQMIGRAENMANKITCVLTYLDEDAQQVNEVTGETSAKQKTGLQMIEAQEEERRRISREIHDGPAQTLANILLRTELVDRAFQEKSTQGALSEMRGVREMIRSSLYEVRRIIYDLRPVNLDDAGFLPTLKKYAATIASDHEIDIEFTASGEEQCLPHRYETAVFRLVQESLQNTVKHAEASLIKVKIDIRPDNLDMMVSDNGKGFDPVLKNDKSFGLAGMKERIEMLEGSLSIDSDKGKGTKVFIAIPFNPCERQIMY